MHMRRALNSTARAASRQAPWLSKRSLSAAGVGACLGILAGAGDAARAAPQDAPRSFAEALATAGWQVEVLVDGSLLLTPAGASPPSAPTASPEPAAASGDNGWQALEAFGWRVETAADGATLLYPPGAVTASATPPAPAHAEQAGTTPSRSDTGPAAATQAPNARARLASELDTLLTERGWRAEWAPDGSLLLLPLQPASASIRPAAGFVPGAVASGQVGLPLESAAEVQRVAASWLTAIGAPRLLPGPVYVVGEVYLVNILDSAPPHSVRHQVAIHAADGRVVVLR
jgi:hypothetical protein